MLGGTCIGAACCRRHPRACASRNYTDGHVPKHAAHRGVARLVDEVDDSVPPHVTYLAFKGREDVVRELGLSAWSLSRVSRRAAITILTDEPSMEPRLQAVGLPAIAQVQLVNRSALLDRFASYGLRRMTHHSGVGGYSKLLVADLLARSIDHTIVMDTDTLTVRDLAPLWRLRHRLARGGSVLAARRLTSGGACLRGQRIQSGVVLMSLRRMRAVHWTDQLLARVAGLGRPGVPARACGKLVRNDTLVASDQELLSYACLASRACEPMPTELHQDKCDGMMGGADVLIFHFNCRGNPKAHCPNAACTSLAKEYARLFT